MHILLSILTLLEAVKHEAHSALSLSSAYEMEKLFRQELRAIELLKSSVQHESVKKAVEKIYPNSLIDVLKVSNPEEYVSHPINAVSLARRTGYYSGFIKSILKENNDTYSEVLSLLETFPDRQEYYDACSSMSLLAEAYELNSTDVCLHGDVRGYRSLFPPDWEDMFNFGITSFNRGWYDSGLIWMKYSIDNMAGGKDLPEYFNFLKEYKKSILIHDKTLEQKGPSGRKHRTFRVPFDSKLRKKKKYSKILKKGEDIRYQNIPSDKENILENDSPAFHASCREQNPKPALFKCHLVHNGDPYGKLGPFKAEILSKRPFVTIFHEFMSDSETNHFIIRAKDKLERSRTGSFNLGDLGKGLLRTSKQVWLVDKVFNISHFYTKEEIDMLVRSTGNPKLPYNYRDFEVIQDHTANKVNQRIGKATKFNVEDAWAVEPYQIANYGLGGQYDLHHDPHGIHEEVTLSLTPQEQINYSNMGDRIATFMVYLKDVKEGGGTVFPNLNLYTKAKKGSAVFWINFLANGRIDRRLRHGGCPVLVGSKWITNKWIHYYAQWDICPCPINQNSDMTIGPKIEHY